MYGLKVTPVVLAVVLATTCPARARAADKPLSEKEKIEALIKHVEGLKDAVFVRNDTEYDSQVAARFLRGKWEQREKEIKTARDFIDKVASSSSTTGKPYLLRFKGGREMKGGEYLRAELEKLEKASK
jgi:hypothetical protein